MLEYEWGNPSTIMLAGDDSTQDSDQSRQIFDNYHQSLADNNHHHHFLSHSTTTSTNNAAANNAYSHNHFLSQQQQQPQQHHSHSDIHSIYEDPRCYSTSPYPNPSLAMLTLDPVTGAAGVGGNGGFLVNPKTEEFGHQGDYTARIGLNLGHRTYFSSDDDFVNRLYRRSRPGPLDSGSINTPRCQAEGCTADLSHAKHYHRRHKVCEFHSKSSTVIAAGLTQRFCQQCSRFHLLSEFDNGKRSCRKRLADHNRRRRKSQHNQQPNQDHHHHHHHQIKSSAQPEIACSISSSENLTRSPPDSGAHSSSVTVAVSPPRMSLDCFRQRSYNGTVSSGSSNLLFYSNE